MLGIHILIKKCQLSNWVTLAHHFFKCTFWQIISVKTIIICMLDMFVSNVPEFPLFFNLRLNYWFVFLFCFAFEPYQVWSGVTLGSAWITTWDAKN